LSHNLRQCLRIVMLDVDHFKQVNDRYGHKVGETVLQSMLRVLVLSCGAMDWDSHGVVRVS